MSLFDLDAGNCLYFTHHAPSTDTGKTFVFFNALTGDLDMWEGEIGAALRDAGHGTLSFNFRGQRDSAFTPDTAITPDLIVADACALLGHLQPIRPVYVGLSIGGLFAMRAHLSDQPSAAAESLVLINTLRVDGPRLQWVNDAVQRAAEVGGLELFRDLFLPLLFAEPWLAKNRGEFLQSDTYQPLDKAGGHYNLLSHAGGANWDVPYEHLDLPVLVMTGLEDHVFLDAQAVDTLTARLPNAERLDIPDAGHLLPAEAPGTVAEALLNFAKAH